MAKIGVIIVCAGKSKRLGVDKTLFQLNGKPLFYHTYTVFRKIKNVAQIVMVLRGKHFAAARKLIRDEKVLLVEGGEERYDSVRNGLSALDEDINFVLIHDGARPFVTKEVISRVIAALRRYPAVICGMPARDTVKFIGDGWVEKTLERKKIFLVQTPQGFNKDLIRRAYAGLKDKNVTDDGRVVELAGEKIKVVAGSPLNIKITYPQDLIIAKAIIKSALE
jgi:2-C-methyl-D-erythritol 4-phosphate cytidylyltransferase